MLLMKLNQFSRAPLTSHAMQLICGNLNIKRFISNFNISSINRDFVRVVYPLLLRRGRPIIVKYHVIIDRQIFVDSPQE